MIPWKRAVRKVSHLLARTQKAHLVSEAVFHGPIGYTGDGMVLSQAPAFMDDEDFRRALAAAARCGLITGPWRVFVCCWFARLALRVDGDFVECGVNTGSYARAIIEYVDFVGTGRTFHLLDTFSGLDESLVSAKEVEAGIDHYFGAYSDTFERVKAEFSGLNANIIRGAVPGTLSQCTPERVAYLSLDMNCAAPEAAALEYFWERMPVGGVVMFDDHGFPRHVHQREANETFAKRVGAKILSLPTGQAVILK